MVSYPQLIDYGRAKLAHAEKLHGIVAYAVAIRCYEFDLPHERLDDIVSRMLDASLAGEPRGKQGDYTEFGYY
jgi:hypothetical protein